MTRVNLTCHYFSLKVSVGMNEILLILKNHQPVVNAMMAINFFDSPNTNENSEDNNETCD